MERISVNSSNIKSIGYDKTSQKLVIFFHSGGRYRYSNIPESMYNELMNAPSHGKYFHKNIQYKTQYPCEKI